MLCNQPQCQNKADSQAIKNQPFEDTRSSLTARNLLNTFKSQDFQLCDIVGNWQKGYLYAIDIHAASQKILFEKQLANPTIIKSRKSTKTFHVERYYLQTLTSKKDIITKKGWDFQIQSIQSCQIAVKLKTVPYFYGEETTQIQFENLLKSLHYQQEYQHSRLQLTQMATYSCRNSPKIGDQMSNQQIRKMLRNLGEIKASFNCPHGRPTIFSLGKASQFNTFKKQKKYQF